MEDLLNSRHGSCWFTKLDLGGTYHQILIVTSNSQNSPFSAEFCFYGLRVLPFGLEIAPSQFMCMMNGILEPMKCKFMVAYIDEIMIHSLTLAEHIVHVQEVCTLQTEHGFKAKRAKCAWAWQKVNFCGVDIDKDGIHAKEHTSCAVMDWPQPECSKDSKGFLGLTSYY